MEDPKSPTKIQICVVGGTGLMRLLLPVATIYYGRLWRYLLQRPHVITLPFAGLLASQLRHFGIKQVIDRKVVDPEAQLILIGHSQAALEAVIMGLRHPERVIAVICLSGPFDGAPLATRMSFIPVFPGIRAMQKGSEQLRYIRSLAKKAGMDRRMEENRLVEAAKNGDRSRAEPSRLPEIHLFGADHDWLVPQGSALDFSCGYPPRLMHRYLLVRERQNIMPDTQQIVVPWMCDGHIGEVLSGHVARMVADIIERHDGEPDPNLLILPNKLVELAAA